MRLTREQLRLLLRVLISEEGRCGEHYGVLTTLGVDSDSDAWQRVTVHLTRIRELQGLIHDELAVT